jgi:plasmid stabilization system protein ParE
MRVAATIYNGVTKLKEFPDLGRASSRVIGWRELVFPPLPYIVVYRIHQDVIEIGRVYHGAQDWP